MKLILMVAVLASLAVLGIKALPAAIDDNFTRLEVRYE